jgi:hypothetical protein
MELGVRRLTSNTREVRVRGRRANVAAIAVIAAGVSFFASASPVMAATPSTLAVAVVGPGAVTSAPPGINCPAKCSASFAPGTSVVLTAKATSGAQFMRWGGSCAGTAGCSVKVAGLAVVGAQFAGSTAPVQPVTHSVAVPGTYVGTSSQGYRSSFLITPGGASIRNISVATTVVSCVPGGGRYDDLLWVPEATVHPNGSFSATGAQSGVWGGYKAIFSYTFSGNLQAATAKGPASGTGSLRENISYSNGTNYQCTTDGQTWTDSLTGPKLPASLVPVQGDYSGTSSQGYGTTFSVSPGGGSLQNISAVTTIVACTPGGGRYDDHLTIAHAVIHPDGSFAATGSQTGVFGGQSATFKYSFTGNYEGFSTSGVPQAFGSLREDISYSANGATYSCTTNNQTWSALRS